MSLVDEAREMRHRIAARLRELEPLVREYEELSQVAAEMGLAETPPEGEATADEATPDEASTGETTLDDATTEDGTPVVPLPTRSAAGEGDLSARVLDAVRADPGKTAADYAQVLGVAPTVLYRPLRRLTTDGLLVKRARQLFPNR